MNKQQTNSFEYECAPKMRALADETRWRIVSVLLKAEEPLTATDLVNELGVSNYNISKHLRILREAGIVSMKKSGKFVHCELVRKPSNETEGKKVDLGCCTLDLDDSEPDSE